MAAYGDLVSLMNDLDLIQTHPRHSFSFETKQIDSISQHVNFLIHFLETYDSHRCNREAAAVLEGRIASAARAVHHVVQSHVLDQIHVGWTLRQKVRPYFFLDLQKAIDNVNFVKRKAMQFKAKGGMKEERPTYSTTNSSNHHTSGKNTMVGFDAVLFRLIEMLNGEPSTKLVIPIVGMGGIGKTTLSKTVYEHLHIQNHFDVRCWATVSQEYSADSILIELLDLRKSTTGGNVDELGLELHRHLWGRRYLVVLDDMWSVEAWEEIQMFLPDNGNGSRVIVTTRLSNLASNLSSSSPIEMEFLNADQSWKLFCGTAFGEEECPVELEGIGKKIVRKCQGLPLSIVIIGGHLRTSSREIEHWEQVGNLMEQIWSSEEGEKCMEIINLSYHHLPVCLKPCFLYMGRYAEDKRIKVTELVRLWVAEGFLKPKESLTLEEVAEDYLKDLVDRNLVIVRRRRWNGKPAYCGIHDIVRELCLKVGKKEKFLCGLDSPGGVSRERRIVTSSFWKQQTDHGLLCDLICSRLPNMSGYRYFNMELGIWEDRGCSLPADFQEYNCRYLAISRLLDIGETCSLPWSISLFWNLQTLNIEGWGATFIAPQEIWEMVQLRHIEFYSIYLPSPLQETIVLRNLQALIGAVKLNMMEDVCGRMPNIKKLRVSDSEITQNLGHFIKLESLDLHNCHFIESFTLPSCLQELHIEHSNIHWEYLGVVIKSLPHLGSLFLVGVDGDEWRLVEEEFRRLKTLRIGNCQDLNYWMASSSNFPVLETLQILDAPKLSEIPFGIGDIPTLALIKMNYCSVSACVSAMRILAEQESQDNHDLQLSVQFSRTGDKEKFQKMVQQENLGSNNLRLQPGFQEHVAALVSGLLPALLGNSDHFLNQNQYHPRLQNRNRRRGGVIRVPKLLAP